MSSERAQPEDGTNDQGITIEIGKLARLGGCMFGIANAFYLTLSSAPMHLSAVGGDTAAGAATTISTAATAAASAFAPRMIARLGRRAVFAIAALALGLPGFAVFGSDVLIAETACAVRGMGLGFAFVAAGGLATALAPPARRGEFLGLYGLAFSIPAIFAVSLGVWLLAHLGPAAPAVAASASALTTLLGLAAFPGRTGQPQAMHSWSLPWRRVGWPVVALTGGAAAVGMMITVFASMAGPAGAEATVALAMFVHGLAAAFARWWGGRLGDQHGHRKLIAVGCVLSVAAALLLAPSCTPAVLAIGAGTLGFGFGFQRNGTLTLMLARTDRAETDGVNAVWNIAYDAGLGLGALSYGCLAPMFGSQAALIAITIVIALATSAGFLLFEQVRCLSSDQPGAPQGDRTSAAAI
jgi:MFS family permease